MRSTRIKESTAAYYHIMSRVIDRRYLLNAAEKERFRRLMRAAEAFSGVRILTYAILDNHFHLLLHVPDRRPISDREFVRRLDCLYDGRAVQGIAGRLLDLRNGGNHAAAQALKDSYTYRMYEISEFAKTLKQRFSQSYNKRHGRKGTLWEGRFKSLLVEGRQCEAPEAVGAGALLTVAAYIDLNAVKAGIVKDPKDYRFCGYGEALGGSRRAREAIKELLVGKSSAGGWIRALSGYRRLLYLKGEAVTAEDGSGHEKPGFSTEEVSDVLKSGGQLSLGQLLRCHVRYFSDGVALGSRAYVDDLFERHRHQFGVRRTTGARPMVGGQWNGLCTARRLRLSVITVPGS